MGRGRGVPSIKKGDWTSVRQAINRLSAVILGSEATPTFTGLTLTDLTQGSVVFAGASGVLSQDNSKLFWDDTNNRLGIGTINLDTVLHIKGSGTDGLTLERASGGQDTEIKFVNENRVYKWIIHFDGAVPEDLFIYPLSADQDLILQTDEASSVFGNVGIGVTDPDAKLEVFNAGTQLKLSYDASNYITFAVQNDGDLTLDSNKTSYNLDFGDGILNAAGLTLTGLTANRLTKTNASSVLTASGIIIDGSDNLSGIGTIASGAHTITDDAGDMLVLNNSDDAGSPVDIGQTDAGHLRLRTLDAGQNLHLQPSGDVILIGATKDLLWATSGNIGTGGGAGFDPVDIYASDDINAGDSFYASAGASDSPAYSFTATPNTGVSHAINNVGSLDFVVAGGSVGYFGTTGLFLNTDKDVTLAGVGVFKVGTSILASNSLSLIDPTFVLRQTHSGGSPGILFLEHSDGKSQLNMGNDVTSGTILRLAAGVGTGGSFDQIPGAGFNVHYFVNASNGENKYIRMTGYPSGIAKKYGQFQMVDVGGANRFNITTEDAIPVYIDRILAVGDGTNETQISATGVQTMTGTARIKKHFIWGGMLGLGLSAPSVRTTEVPYVSYTYAVNDDSHISFEAPSDMDFTEDSTIKVHWYTSVSQTDDEVKWRVEWNSRAIGETINAGSTAEITADINCSAQWIIVETILETIAGNSIASDDELGFDFGRIAITGGGSNPQAGTIHVLSIEFEYTSNKHGEPL